MAEAYHFAQPNVAAPKKIFEPSEGQLAGFQAVAWNTSINGIIANKNHVEAIITSSGSEYKKATDEIATVQFQRWWGINSGVKAWDGTKYGYDVNKVRLLLGAIISIPQNTGGAIGYSTFYIRGIEINSKIRYWLQFSLFDERATMGDSFYMDNGLTGEPCFSGQLGVSSYFSLIPTSATLKKSVFSSLTFFGISISRQQLWNLMTEFKSRLNVNISPEPNLHKVFACGMTPELGAADPGGIMKFVGENMFLRTEY